MEGSVPIERVEATLGLVSPLAVKAALRASSHRATGIVRRDGDPVPGLRLVLTGLGSEAVTDALGDFTFPHLLPYGRYHGVVSDPMTGEVEVILEVPGPTEIDLQAAP
jgi:hypothetical protein